MLRVTELSLIKSARPILSGVNLELKVAEKLAVVGANGAGKSSLLKCLAGLYDPNSGRVEIAGENLNKLSRLEVARRIAYLPQQFEVWSPLSVIDFMLMARYAHSPGFRAFSKTDLKLCEQALELCKMLSFRDKDLRSLSGGERQLVMIAGALAQQAQILLLDEPTTFLDLQNQHLVQQVLKDLFSTLQITVVAATHDLNSALLGYERILGLREGCVVYDGPAKDFLDNGTLIAVYGRDFIKVQHPQSGVKVVLPDDFGMSVRAGQN